MPEDEQVLKIGGKHITQSAATEMNNRQLGRLRAAITRVKIAQDQLGRSAGLSEAISRIRALRDDSLHTLIPLAERLTRLYSNGIPTPVLSVCGHGTQEVRFTRYLAYYLDPSRPHGLGASLLRAVLKNYVPDEGLMELASGCEVVPELWLGEIRGTTRRVSCYCDIGIIAARHLVLIEQKILAGESQHPQSGLSQLKRYDRALRESPLASGKQITKILLTPRAHIPADTDWVALSHQQFTERAAALLNHQTLPHVARENLRRLLMDLIVGPYQRSEDEVLALIRCAKRIAEGGATTSDLLRFGRLVSYGGPLLKILEGGASR